MTQVSNWEKFVLLLWKNWILQWNHKWQLIIELLLPAIFSLLLVLIRTLVIAEPMPEAHFKELPISTLDLFNATVNNHGPNNELYYSPTNSFLEDIVKEATKNLGLDGCIGFDNASAMQNALADGKTFAGIEFDESYANLTINKLPNKFNFALRFPSELRTASPNIIVTWLTMRLFPVIDMPGPRNPVFDDGGIPVGYLREGFLPLQHAISMAYIKHINTDKQLPEVVIQRFPYPAYNYDPLLEGLSSFMSLMILLSFIYPCTYITKYVTAEKEKQLKEVMKIMGLPNWIHWTAWFVKSFIMLTLSAILMAVFLKIRWTNNVAVLTQTSFTALLFFLIIYLISSICFCFMLATFFSKASTAAAVTGLLWFIAYIPFTFTINTYDDLSLTTKLGWSLISNTAMGFGIKLILGFEGNGEGLQWSNLLTPVSVDDQLTVGAVILMMLVSCVFYMLICLYIEQIFPGDFGVGKKWNFPFTKQFWCCKRVYIGVEDILNVPHTKADAFEIEPEGKHIGLQVRNLKKCFGNNTVVKGLSINMYEDEITVMLGHNGAGKTTTISMLTGMFSPTAGTAIINGSDIRTNIDGARMSLGICPQHNVLFDDLSVRNHIVFFSCLKGVKGKDIQSEVDKYLRLIELEDKSNIASSKLSGGMKRKLSVCCALCGNTKVVLCDEPSSGMDPSARRQLWDLLQAEKVGRTILLTTHFMDEADVLGDRIAIMCDGELKCHGTSFFLKKKYGSGYRLICVKRENCNPAEVTALLNQYIPDLVPESDVGAELSYQLSDNFSSVFEEMFGALESKSEQLYLNGYGVGITSMEEVFMKVGAETVNDDGPKQIHAGENIAFSEDDDIESIRSDRIFSESTRLVKGSDLFQSQWHAMLLKKALYTYRNWLLLLIQNIMPIFFVVVTILIARTQGTFNELKPITFSLKQYPLAVTVLENATNSSFTTQTRVADEYKYLAESYGSQYTFESTGSEKFKDYILTKGETIQVRINSRYLAAATISNDKIIAWLNNQPLHTAPLTLNLVHNAIARALTNNNETAISVTNAPLPYRTQTRLTQLNMGNNMGTQLATNLCFCMCFVSSFYILFLIKERESRSKLLQFVGGVRVWIFWMSQLVWDLFTYILTAVIVIITIACFQEDGFSKFSELGRYFLVLLVFGFSALPFTYIVSRFFTESATGFARISIINIFAGMALFIVVVVMSFELFDTKNTADILSWFFRIFPHFSLAMGLNKIYTNVVIHNLCEKHVPGDSSCYNLKDYFDWKEPGILPETIYMIITSIIFFTFIVVSEYGLFNELMYLIKKNAVKLPLPPEEGYFDDDVELERQQILHMSSEQLREQNLVLDRVTKNYGQFLAVNQVSLCIKHNECFGLLGVNGAGKTTTFKMMTGDERITSGNAYVKGMNLNSEMNEIYKEIGYCPQFDALLDDLTGREILKIFCLLRGISRLRINQISEELAKSFGFIKHIDKQTRSYSGGNKRKLSTAIAVIGSPSVIYLDEPTTGMDPAARRQLWDMVCRIRDSGKSIVLTSHSMEECEALCTRLAIMVNGEFKCIGSTQHLKNKFSKGLILKIKVKRRMDILNNVSNNILNADESAEQNPISYPDINSVKQFVEQEFEHSILQEEYQGILTFYIPLSSIKWSKIFGLVECNRYKLNIEDYSISQTTLEEIFLEFAKYQREDTRALK